MNYNIRLEEINAEKHCPPQQEGELFSEWQSRVELSKGKAVLRFAAMDDDTSTVEQQQVTEAYSPFFDIGDAKVRSEMIVQAMSNLAKHIVDREWKKLPPSKQDKFSSKLVTDPAETARILQQRKLKARRN